ncbi:MAG: protein kinase [Candidatus Aureabacteria bacterium]|nr:protein kinase [Candidatus Auribacterota bacterium]
MEKKHAMNEESKHQIFEKLAQSVSAVEILKTDFNLPGYNLVRFLGKGAMGLVFECENIFNGNRYAVKILNPQYTQDEKINQQFEQEARLIAKLKHENIISVFDLKKTEGIYYLLMELCPGKSLSKVLKEEELPFPVILHIVERLLDALKYAHEKKIVHHDVKPGNVMMVEGHRPILCDFGLATIQTDVMPASVLKRPFGTPHFMSPEKIRGDWTSRNEHSSDIFAMGVLFYYMVTRHYPFPGTKREELYHQIQYMRPVDPMEINPCIPLSINAIIHKFLEKDSRDRYRSAGEALTDISNFRSNRPISLFKKSWTYTFIQAILAHKIRSLVTGTLLFIFLFLTSFFVLKKIRSDSLWIPDPYVKTLFSKIGFENKWNALDPVRMAVVYESSLHEFFDIQKNSLTSIPKKNFLLFQKTPSVPADCLFRIQTQGPFPLEGQWGLFYGDAQTSRENHRGIYFMISSAGIDIHYPHATAPVLAHVDVENDFRGTAAELKKEFPFLEFRVNKRLIIRLNLLFFPFSSSSFGVVSMNSNRTFQKPVFYHKDPHFSGSALDAMLGLVASDSPLKIALDLLNKGEYTAAANELENLQTRTSDLNLLSEIAYYLAFCFFNGNRNGPSFTLLEKQLPAIRKGKKNEVQLLLNWVNYLASPQADLAETIPHRMNQKQGERLLVLLFLKRFPSEEAIEKENGPERYFREFSKLKQIDHRYLVGVARLIAKQYLKENPEKALLFMKKHHALFYEKDPFDSETGLAFWIHITEELKKEKKFQEAIRLYENLIQEYPERSEVIRTANLGLEECYLILGEYKKAAFYRKKS